MKFLKLHCVSDPCGEIRLDPNAILHYCESHYYPTISTTSHDEGGEFKRYVDGEKIVVTEIFTIYKTEYLVLETVKELDALLALVND